MEPRSTNPKPDTTPPVPIRSVSITSTPVGSLSRTVMPLRSASTTIRLAVPRFLGLTCGTA